MLLKKLLKAANWLIFASLTLLMMGFTTEQRNTNPQDPLETYNRSVYKFNDVFDRFLLKPAATVYKKILPPPVMKGINNVFFNLSEIPTVINDVMQANLYQATADSWRFVINSSVGILGFFDVASRIGLEKNTQDVGLTFAKWGYKDSTYFVLPFFGPSTIRDTVAWPLNYYLTVFPYIKPVEVRYSLVGTNWLNQRAQLLDFEDVRKQAALDPYEFQRSSYLQKRNYAINHNPIHGKKDFVEE